MQQVQEHISRVHAKLQDLLKKHTALMRENEQQKKTITALKEQQELNEKKIKVLGEQQQFLKSAAASLNDADKKAFEQSINRYIREIDKCIALLSE